MTIKRQLLIFVLCAILPIFIFSAILLGFVVQQQTHSFEQSLNGNVRALSQAVENQISSIESSLAILAVVEDFDDANLRDLHRRLRRFVKTQNDWSSIGLASIDGQQIFSSRSDYGDPLQNWSDQPFFQDIIKTGKSQVSGFRIGKLIHQPVFSVGVPVKEKGKIKYVLVATMHTQLLSNMLLAQKLPTTWNAAVIDSKGLILARSRLNEKFLGKPVMGHIQEQIKMTEGFFEGPNLEGSASFGAHSSVKKIDWHVVLSIPFAESQFGPRKIFWILIVGGLGLLSIGMALALFIGQRIANSIMGLSGAAQALGKGDNVHHVTSNLTEINDVSLALVNASIERAKSDKNSQDLYKKAQEAVELRDNFLSVASHELKTPLTTINLQAQILERMLKKDDLAKDKLNISVGRIGNQLKRLTSLIDDLLDISRISSGRLEIHKEEADLTEITREIVTQFEEDYVAKGSALIFTGEAAIQGLYDKGRVEQIITNLVSNAIKYGEGKPITVEVKSVEDLAIVRVTDLGKGIDPSYYERIFERFERVDPSREVNGLGLGLWIVKRLVERMEGTITVESAGAGAGSTFILKLPKR